MAGTTSPRAPLPGQNSKRDWSVALGTAAFQPTIDFSFTISPPDCIRFSERDGSGRRRSGWLPPGVLP